MLKTNKTALQANILHYEWATPNTARKSSHKNLSILTNAFLYNLAQGCNCLIYSLGVRYAKAPTDDLRFKRPQNVSSWTGIKKATSSGSMCPQTASGMKIYSEP